MKTLLLDTQAWDLVLDSNGNIALADVPYAQAQDAASAIRTFKSECWYDNTLGIPYFQKILDKLPPFQYVAALVEQQALTVPGVAKARCTITQFSKRNLRGVVEIINTDGVAANVGFTQ